VRSIPLVVERRFSDPNFLESSWWVDHPLNAEIIFGWVRRPLARG
jgi:hypothetical protein